MDQFLKSKAQLTCYAPIDLKLADIYIRDGYDNGSNTPTTTDIEDIGETDIALSNMDTVVPDPAVTTGVTVKFGSDEQEYTVTARVTGGGTNEVQEIEIDDDVDGGTFTLTYGGYTTGTIAYNASTAVVEAALEALNSIGLGRVAVTGAAPIWIVTFADTLGNTDVALITGNGTALTNGTFDDVNVDTVAGSADTDEIQTLEMTGGTATQGVIQLGFNGQVTGDIVYNATAAAVELALEALSTIEVDDLTVAGGDFPTAITVAFGGTLGGAEQPMLTLEKNTMDDSTTCAIMETTPHVDGDEEVVTISINDSITGGTFTLTETQDTAPILYNASAAVVQAALIAGISSISSGDIVVTGGPGPETDWVITFTSAGDKAAITGTGTNLTGGDIDAVSISETTKGVTGTGTSQITVTPALLIATTVGGSVTFGGRKLEIRVGEGNMNFTENTPREYLKNRGLLDTVRDADEEPMDVSFEFIWEFLSAVGSSATPTVKETLKQIGEASTWVSTSDDACEPYCVNIEVQYDPACGGANTEKVELKEFRPETLEHNIRDAQISCTGKCNVTGAVETRGA